VLREIFCVNAMALCKAMILLGASLLVPTFQMRIKQARELTSDESSAASLEEGPEADKQDIESQLERLRQRFASPDVMTTAAKAAVKKTAAKADADARNAGEKATAKAKEEKANGRAKKGDVAVEKSAAKMVAQDRTKLAKDKKEVAKTARPEVHKQQRAPAVADSEGMATRAKRAAKPNGDARGQGKARAEAKKEEKEKEHAKKPAAEKAAAEKAAAQKPTAKKIVDKAGGDARKAVAKADEQDLELTLERLRQRFANPELIQPAEEPQWPTRAKQEAAKRVGDARHAGEKAMVKANEEKPNSRAKKAPSSEERARPAVDKQERAPAVAKAKGSESPEKQKDMPTSRSGTRRAAVKAAKADVDARHAEDKAREKEENAKEHVKKVAADKAAADKAATRKSAPKKIVAKAGGDAPKPVVKAAGPQADKQDIELTLQRLQNRYAKPELIMDPAEEQKDQPTRAKQMAKKWEAKAAGPEVNKHERSPSVRSKRHAEDKATEKEEKAKEHAKKVAVDKATARRAATEKPAKKKLGAYTGENAPTAVAEAATPEEDKEDIEVTLERLRQRFANPERVRQTAPEEPTRAKQAVEKKAAKSDGDARNAGETTSAKARKEKANGRATIFANGFDYGTDEEAVKKHFGAVGAIKELHFQSRGAAVITYVKSSSATRAVDELHETTIEGQSHYVMVKLDDPDSNGKGKGEAKDSGKGGIGAYGRTIFVTGFDLETDDEALTKHFGNIGAIEDFHFHSKRSAVITYVKASAAQQAVTKLDGSTMRGQSWHVVVKMERKTEEEATLSQATLPDLVAEKTKRTRHGKKELAKIEGQKVDIESGLRRLRIAPVVAEVEDSESAEQQKATKEEKAKEYTKKSAVGKATADKVAAGKLAAKKLVADAGGDAPKVVAEAAGTEADKQDIELTLKRLKQRYMQPEVVYDSAAKKILVEAGPDAPKAVAFSKRRPRRTAPTVTA